MDWSRGVFGIFGYIILIKMGRGNYSCLVLMLVLLCSSKGWAQFEASNVVKHYNIQEGLSQGVVNSIVEDSESLLWFATEDGLNRFDGYNFKVFKYNKSSGNGFTDNFVQSLFRDSDGILWISSRSGLMRFNPDIETFDLYKHDFKSKTVATPNDVSFITEGSANNLWVAWYGNGFGSFNKTNNQFTRYNKSTIPDLTSDHTVTMIEDDYGILWVGTQNGGLNVFNVGNGQIVDKIEALSNPAELPSLNIRCIVQDSRKNIWIGTSNGLVVYLREKNQFLNFDTAHESIGRKSIFSLLSDSNENLWIGTQGNGLFRLDLRQFNTQAVHRFVFNKIQNLDDFDVSRRTIQSFYEDSNGNIWIGTFGDGVYMLSKQKEKFIKIQKVLHQGSTFTSVPFYGMCYDQKGNLWFGTDGNGLYKRDPNGGESHYVANEGPGSLKDNAILSACSDSKGRLWFGTYAQGVFQYDERADAFIHYVYKGEQANAGASDVRVIFEDSRGNIWVGTNRGGLCLLDISTRSYRHPESFTGLLKEGDVRAIREDRFGNLWLGFYGDGLYRFNYSNNSLDGFFQDASSSKSIQSRVIFALNFDGSGKLWIGTAGSGLFCYNPGSNILTGYSEAQGLGNNTVYSILIDKNNNCWVSTNAGVSKVEASSGKVVNYLSLDGLQEGQFNPSSGLHNYIAGYMCFGGTHGLNVFYPEQIQETRLDSKVIISGLQIFNRPVSVRDTIEGRTILERVINKTETLVLEHDESVITFEFVGLNFSYPEKNQYAYMMEELDNQWNFVGSQRSATYRYLKPGSYVFKVKASNQQNEWGEEFTSLNIRIKPPVWRTPWAYGLYVLAGIVFGFLFLRFGRKQLSLRKRLKIEKAQRKYEQRMAKEKLTFFTEISHEFRTPLTLIMGPLEEMLTKEGEQSPNWRKLNMVYRNASKLLNLINKLLDYRKIESGNVILKIAESDMISFVEEIFETFRDLAKKKNIKFTFSSDRPSINVWYDKEKLEMVISNILSNSFKYIGTGDEIAISVNQQTADRYPHGRVVIKVRDNGIGIPKKHLGSIFDWFYKGENSGTMNSGIGLSLAKKLVHLHKGEIFVESAEGKGSVFSIKMPLGKDHFKPEEVTIVKSDLPTTAAVTLNDPPEELPGHKGVSTLLIVEDDDEIRTFLREYFESEFKIQEATDGDTAFEMANSVHPDLIISDIMMPGKDGIELCKILKENVRTSHIPLILLTARTSLTHHKEGIEIGADAYITKPFSPEMLALTVNNLLQSRKHLMRFYRTLFINNDTSGETNNTGNTPDERFLHSVYDHLKLNLDKADFNISELADALNMSRSLVYKKIKMLTGLAPVEYIRSLRMQEAAKLLRSHQYKVFEVVYMVGFSDLKYFRQCFAKEFGASPSEYMKQQSEPIK